MRSPARNHALPTTSSVREWVSEDGFLPNEKFVEYASPLIAGETKVPTENGLPKYIVLEKVKIEKKLPARVK